MVGKFLANWFSLYEQPQLSHHFLSFASKVLVDYRQPAVRTSGLCAEVRGSP